jgi:hypothetical protein
VFEDPMELEKLLVWKFEMNLVELAVNEVLLVLLIKHVSKINNFK